MAEILESVALLTEVTPMMQQYLDVKSQYQDYVLMYRLGDFYEMFFEDAVTVSRELELTLTSRDCGNGRRAAMCGVPFHKADLYIGKLVERGHKVAVCEQTEDPAQAKGLVRREVIRVVTPGTVTDGTLLNDQCNNFLAALCYGGKEIGLAFADISTGQINATAIAGDHVLMRLKNEIGAHAPKEMLLDVSRSAMHEIADFAEQSFGTLLNADRAELFDENDAVKELENFFSVVELFVEKEDEYVALTATAGEGNLVSYYDGETLIATVDTYKGLYTFAAGTEGLSVKISVLPSEEYYLFESFNPVVLEAEIVKAYNVYEAWELAVIDNDNTDDREGNADWNDTRVWDTFKTEKGIANLTVSGIVLHCDLHLSADDVPEAFFMTTTQDLVYTNSVSGETKTVPAGTKYLRDWSDIYRRILNPAETFVMEGNFFSISLANFPLVASPAVFGAEGNADDYGQDFSNSDFIKFINNTEVTVENYAQVTINNFNIIGNAARDNWVDADEYLVSAGGLIFLKSTHFVSVEFDNIIGNSFFITYFCDDRSVMNVANVKCYDSYQNAIYMWGEAKMNVVDSFFIGAGGPMAIISSPDIRGGYARPTLVATNTLFDTHLSGEEIWFAAIGGNAIVAQMKGLSDGLKQATLGSFVDDNGKMNIQGLIMPEGSNASQVVTGIGAQGVLSLNAAGMNRNQGADNIHWMTIYQISQMAAQATGSMPPFLTVYDEAGAPHTIFFNGQTFVDLQQRPLGTDASHAQLLAAFQAAEDVTLTMGGISVVLEFYH